MKINDIADGAITVEMQPDEAMDLAVACHIAELAVYSGHDCGFPSASIGGRERRYETLCAVFEALAVAGNAQYSVSDSFDLAESALAALRAMKR